jgi:hypothetical protein
VLVVVVVGLWGRWGVYGCWVVCVLVVGRCRNEKRPVEGLYF